MPGKSLARRPFLCVIAGAALCLDAHASAAPAWVSIKTLPGFDDAPAQLQALVDRNGHRAVNRLCVVGQKDGTHFQAEVYWPEENKLILWVSNANDPETLVHSRRYLDLTRDVRQNVGTSTSLISTATVAETIKACSVTGEHFVVRKSAEAARADGWPGRQPN